MKNIIKQYKNAIEDIYKHVGFEENILSYPLEIYTDVYWYNNDENVYLSCEDWTVDTDFCFPIFKSRCYNKSIYIGRSYTLIFCIVRDQRRFLVFSKSKQVELTNGRAFEPKNIVLDDLKSVVNECINSTEENFWFDNDLKLRKTFLKENTTEILEYHYNICTYGSEYQKIKSNDKSINWNGLDWNAVSRTLTSIKLLFRERPTPIYKAFLLEKIDLLQNKDPNEIEDELSFILGEFCLSSDNTLLPYILKFIESPSDEIRAICIENLAYILNYKEHIQHIVKELNSQNPENRLVATSAIETAIVHSKMSDIEGLKLLKKQFLIELNEDVLLKIIFVINSYTNETTILELLESALLRLPNSNTYTKILNEIKIYK